MASQTQTQQVSDQPFSVQLKEAQLALTNLKQCKFENIGPAKSNFEDLYLAFKKMKGLNNDLLPEYCRLMNEIVQFLHSPLYINFFKSKDKKLTKNMVKRCVVEPFRDKFMKRREDYTYEISRFSNQPTVFETLNNSLIELDEYSLLTETLKTYLKHSLEEYLGLIENVFSDRPAITAQLPHIKALLVTCKMAQEDIDYNNPKQVQKLFNQKKVQKLSNYIRELNSLNNILIKDKKLLKKLFKDKPTYHHFLMDNVEWMLEKGVGAQLSEEEVNALATFCKKNSSKIVKGTKQEIMAKFDTLLRKFLSEQKKQHPKLNIEQYLDSFKYEEPKQKISQLHQQREQELEAKQQEVQQLLTNKIFNKKYQNLESFFNDVVMAFSDAKQPQYTALDYEVGEILHKVYEKQLGAEAVNNQLFQILDQRLGGFNTPFQARNYKKVIQSISKNGFLGKSETNILFVKAKRFIDKESVKKEKVKIKNDIKGQYIANNVKEEVKKAVKQTKKEEVEASGSDDSDDSDDMSDDSSYESVNQDSDEELVDHRDTFMEQGKFPPNKRHQREDDRNKQYLAKYREDNEIYQAQKYYEQRTSHKIYPDEFMSDKGKMKILEIEGIVRQIYNEQCVTLKDLQLRDKVIINIKNAFKNAEDKDYPYQLTGQLEISGYGSCQNGTWSLDNSDVDVTCIFHDNLAGNQHQLLKMCSQIIRKVAKPNTLVLVPAQRIPILKFTEKETGIVVDFNVNNLLGIHNSNLIYTYCQIDQRFHIMAVFLKYWAKKVGIIGAAYGYLSSYALVLMIIAFLQSRDPPVLPSLQQKKLRDLQHKKTVYYPLPIDQLESKRSRGGFKKNHDLNKQVYCLTETDVFFETDMQTIQQYYMPKQRNEKSIPELLYEFFYFYAYEFDYNQKVIDIISNSGFSPKYTRDKYPFSIVDPFETSRNPGCSVYLNSDAYMKIMMQFKNALDHFKLN